MLSKLMLFCIFVTTVKSCIRYSEKEVSVKVGANYTTCLDVSSIDKNCIECLTVISQYPDVVRIESVTLTTSVNLSSFYIVNVIALTAGKCVLSAKCSLSTRNFTQEFTLLVRVHHNVIISWLSLTVGWLYFFMWASCTYPQVVKNFRKKSVVGLNFDYVLFSFIGHTVYTIFNAGMFFIPFIKEQYKQRYPRGIEPVWPNDLFFSVHGILITMVTLVQCVIYENANQSVSMTARVIVVIYFLSTLIFVVLAIENIILWLDVLYLCSYIKLYGAIIKYIPQVYMNYQLKSTKGFSILGVFMDLGGSIFSILQVFLDGYNYGDWRAFEENPTKFGLGIISFVFSLVFIAQHYWLYATKPETETKVQTIPLETIRDNNILHI